MPKPATAVAKPAGTPAKVVTLPGIPIAQVGKWKCMTGVTDFTQSMMEAAIEASKDPGIGAPKLKRGHIDPRFDGEPLVGLATNLALDENGFVNSDLAGLDPEEFGENGEVLPFRYPDRSVEGNYNVTSPITGKTYEFAISALALLPIDGAVDTLPDLPIADAFEDAGAAVAASKHFEVAASWSPDSVRSAYRAAHPEPQGGPYRYVREVFVDPNTIIVSVEGPQRDTNIQIPFAVTADGVTFDEAASVEVMQSWVPVPTSSVAASRPPISVARYEHRSSNRPSTPTIEKEKGMDFAKLKTLFDMPESATDDEVRAKAVEHGMTVTETPSDDDKPNTKETPVAKGDDDKPKSLAEQAKSEGFALVDEEVLTELKDGVAVAASLKQERDEEQREEFLNAAVMAGKFKPSRLEHFRNSWNADAEGTKETIEGLAAGLVPVDKEAGVMAAQGATGVDGQVDALAAHFGVPNVAGGK